MQTRVFTTGGTIGGVHGHGNRTRIPTKSPVPNLIPPAVRSRHVIVEELFAKSSLAIEANDLDLIFRRIKDSPEMRCVVMIGTHCMCQAAQYLLDRIVHPIGERLDGIGDKTIVLAGAMREDEGPFELGFALAAVQILRPGVYVTVEGEIFRGDGVRKDERVRPPRFVGNSLSWKAL